MVKTLVLILGIFLSSTTLAQELITPEYPGGVARIEKFVSKQTKKFKEDIPPNRTNNSVKVRYLVSAEGTIQNVTVVEGLGEPFDSEAIRIIKSMPEWKPGNVAIQRDEWVSFGTVGKYDIANSKSKFETGLFHFNNENYEKAAEQFAKAIKYNPYNLDSYYNRAISNLNLGLKYDACADLLYIRRQDKNADKLWNFHCKRPSDF